MSEKKKNKKTFEDNKNIIKDKKNNYLVDLMMRRKKNDIIEWN